MLTSKERAYLRSLAAHIDTIFQIGKSGVGDNMCEQLDNALTARELIKIKTLETSPLTPREAADILGEKLSADVVQVIGTKIVLYRESEEKLIDLGCAK